MHVIEMKLAGRMKKGDVPEYFATIHRVPGNEGLSV